MALTFTPQGELGFTMPKFELPSTDFKPGSKTESAVFSDSMISSPHGVLVVFMCNHCPYVQAIENRLVELGKDVQSLGIQMVGISSNDAKFSPDDSFEKMQARAKEKKYSFPYLYDETQDVAKSFGAVCTPDFFLFDKNKKLVYRGRLDDSWKDASKVTTRELFNICKQLSNGEPVSQEQKPSMGCSIKWKEHS